MSNKLHNKQPDVSGMTRVQHRQELWEWPIAVYLYMAGMGAGAFAFGLLADWFIHPEIPSRGLLLWGPLLVALGAPFLILDLGKKLRFINAAFNPKTSWAARGFAILSSLMVTGIAAFALASLPDILPLFQIEVPDWLANQPLLSRVFESLALILSFGTAAYTGIFLKSTRYVSLWNTWLLPVLFTLSAFSTGAMALIFFLQGFGSIAKNINSVSLTHVLIPIELLLIIGESIALIWLLKALRQAGQTPSHIIKHLAVKSTPSLILGFVLLLAAWFFPESARMSVYGPYSIFIFIAGLVILGGGFLLRYDIVSSGIKDQHPLHKMVAAQYNWKALADGNSDGDLK
jgi:polysulfide reductase chain C